MTGNGSGCIAGAVGGATTAGAVCAGGARAAGTVAGHGGGDTSGAGLTGYATTADGTGIGVKTGTGATRLAGGGGIAKIASSGNATSSAGIKAAHHAEGETMRAECKARESATASPKTDPAARRIVSVQWRRDQGRGVRRCG